jgi:hypothetical protein
MAVFDARQTYISNTVSRFHDGILFLLRGTIETTVTTATISIPVPAVSQPLEHMWQGLRKPIFRLNYRPVNVNAQDLSQVSRRKRIPGCMGAGGKTPKWVDGKTPNGKTPNGV